MVGKLVLLRHGQSVWNVDNLFTGWTDVDLSDLGRNEARQGALEMQKAGLSFDIAFTSVLKRAIRTLWIALDVMDLMWIPVERSWRLNERHYGALQGLDKSQTAEQHGEAQVKIWRRSYDIPPPPLTADDPRHPRFDPRYAGLKPADLPATESLKDTLARVLPFWQSRIAVELKAGPTTSRRRTSSSSTSRRACRCSTISMIRSNRGQAVTSAMLRPSPPRRKPYGANRRENERKWGRVYFP